MATNNIFADVSNDIANSTGSYVPVLTGIESLPTVDLYFGDVILLFLSLSILISAFSENKARKEKNLSSE